MSSRPVKILPNINRQGKVVPGRIYIFVANKFIRDDIVGHSFKGFSAISPHFNISNSNLNIFYVKK